MQRKFSKKFSRLLAVIMAVIMAVCVLPLGVFAVKEKDLTQGQIFEMGSYPQTEVKDAATLAALNALELKWISYNYVSNRVHGDFMKYADVELDGVKYRAVFFNKYRPYDTERDNKVGYSNQDDNGYELNTTYWFKYEPLKWRVLNPSTGLVLCESIIDSQPFYADPYNITDGYIPATGKYASNYATSTVRAWLKDSFGATAFTAEDLEQMVETELDCRCALAYYTATHMNCKYAGETCTDKVYLLTNNEVLTEANGFPTETSFYNVFNGEPSASRQAKGTDYAKVQGLKVDVEGSDWNCPGYSWWLLRNPTNGNSPSQVWCDGGTGAEACYATSGIRPAFNLKVEPKPKTLMERIKDFFQKIIDWFKALFNRFLSIFKK